MPDPITITDLQNAKLDAQTIGDVANGAADLNGDGTTASRTGGPKKTLAKLQAEYQAIIDAQTVEKNGAAASAATAASAANSVLSSLRADLVGERLDAAVLRRASGKKGVIYLTIGQSLSVRRDYSSGVSKLTWTSPHARMIVGGADRNADANVAVNVTYFNAAGDKYESLVQYAVSATQAGKVDGFAMMADVPTVCGIYAIGARDYVTLCKGGSSVFVDTSMFLSQAVKLLRDQGVEDIEVVFSLAHGEAETDNQRTGGGVGSGAPTSAAVYQLFLREWFDDLTQTTRIALDDLTYKPIFLVHQMAGVFNNAWRAIMEATADFADEYGNVHLAGPTAPYGLQADRIHPPGEAQVLMGEWDWHLMKRAQAGLPTCLKSHEFRRSGNTIVVPHTYAEGTIELGIDAVNMTDASGFNGSGDKCKYGVEVFVDGAAVDLTSVTPSALGTTIVLAADPGVGPEILVRFGLMTTVGGYAAVPAFTSRCNIRSNWAGVPSRYLSTFTHKMWVLHDEIEEAS